MDQLGLLCGFSGQGFALFAVLGKKKKGFPRSSFLGYDLRKITAYSCIAYVLLCLYYFFPSLVLIHSFEDVLLLLFAPIFKQPILCCFLLWWNLWLRKRQKAEGKQET